MIVKNVLIKIDNNNIIIKVSDADMEGNNRENKASEIISKAIKLAVQSEYFINLIK